MRVCLLCQLVTILIGTTGGSLGEAHLGTLGLLAICLAEASGEFVLTGFTTHTTHAIVFKKRIPY